MVVYIFDESTKKYRTFEVVPPIKNFQARCKIPLHQFVGNLCACRRFTLGEVDVDSRQDNG